MQYKAFISYSQAADHQLAPVLQSALQGFAKPFYRLRTLHLFRDKTGLSLTPELWPAIQQAISESEYFILLASPDAATSHWVQLEVAEWLKLKGGSVENFLIILTSGEIAWDATAGDFDWARTNALPRNLERRFKSLPLYSDLRWARGANDLSLRHPQFLDDVGSIGAKLHGKSKDVMIGKDVRQHRIFKVVTGATILLLLLLLAVASAAAYYANVQRRVAEQQTVVANEQRAEAERQKNEAQRQRDEADTQRRLAVRAADSEKTARESEVEQRKKAELATKNEKVARRQAEERRLQAEQSAAKEKAAREDAEAQKRTVLLESGRQELNNHNPFRAAIYLSELYKKIPPNEDPGKVSSLRFLLGLSMRSVDSLRYTVSHTEDINSVKFSPNGDQIAIACADNTPDTVNTARVLDVKTGKEVITKRVRHNWDVNTAEFSSDGKKMVTSSDDNHVKVINLETENEEMSFVHRTDVKSAKFSPDDRKIAAIDAYNKVLIWDIETRNVIEVNPKEVNPKEILDSLKQKKYVQSVEFSPNTKQIAIVDHDDENDKYGGVIVWEIKKGLVALLEHQGHVNSAKFSPDGKQLVTASVDRTAKVWDLETGEPEPITLPHQDAVTSAEFSPDGKRLVTISSDKRATIWDIKTRREVASVPHPNLIRSAKFSPDGAHIMTACDDKTVKVWDAVTGIMLASMPHPSFIKFAEFSPDGKQIVTASQDRTVKLWNIETEVIATVSHQQRVISARFSKDGKRVVTASWDDKRRVVDKETGAFIPYTAKVLDIETGVVTTFNHEYPVYTAEFSPDGKQIVTCSGWTARVWDLETKTVIRPVQHSHTCYAAEFSPDGKQVVTASRDETARVVDLKTGRTILFRHQNQVNTAKFSPDGKLVVTTSGDKTDYSGDITARVWDVKKIWDETNWEVVTVREVKPKDAIDEVPHKGGVISAEFSPDGKRIVTASFDGTAKVKDLKTRKITTIQHQALIVSAKFSPDGRWIVTASDDNRASIWNVTTEKVVTTLEHPSQVRSAKFSPDSKQIVTASGDGTAKVWDVTTGRLLASIEHRQLVRSAEFSPDGNRIATASFDTTAKVWSFPRETRTKKEIEELVRIKVPFSLENRALVPR